MLKFLIGCVLGFVLVYANNKMLNKVRVNAYKYPERKSWEEPKLGEASEIIKRYNESKINRYARVYEQLQREQEEFKTRDFDKADGAITK